MSFKRHWALSNFFEIWCNVTRLILDWRKVCFDFNRYWVHHSGPFTLTIKTLTIKTQEELRIQEEWRIQGEKCEGRKTGESEITSFVINLLFCQMEHLGCLIQSSLLPQDESRVPHYLFTEQSFLAHAATVTCVPSILTGLLLANSRILFLTEPLNTWFLPIKYFLDSSLNAQFKQSKLSSINFRSDLYSYLL